MPAVLGIVPGNNWSNFIAAARSGIPYTLEEVVLTKQSPGATGLAPTTVVQTGAAIRLWWPLLYDAPGTTFTLELSYRTAAPCMLAGEKTASVTHRQTWRLRVSDDLESLGNLAEVFRNLSFGVSGAPLISDEALFGCLGERLSRAQSALAGGDLPGVRSAMADFGQAARDGCIVSQPSLPNTTGPGTGIANTTENPAGYRLLIGSESIQTSEKTTITDIVKNVPDGTAVALTEPKTVTLVQPGFFYAQDQSRTCGLKVIGFADGLLPGGQVILRGVMATEGPERVLRLAGREVVQPTGPMPGSLAMPNKSVGGTGQDCLPGFLGGIGLSNGGLRVTVTGRVGTIGAGYFCIDDGSGCADGTTNPGLRIVLLPGVEPPSAASYVRVTGVSAWFDGNGLPEPAILVGTAGDVTTVP